MNAPDRFAEALARAAVIEPPGFGVHAVSGGDAVDLLQRLSTADLAPLADGRAVTTLFLSPTGRLLHRVLVQPGAAGLRAACEATGDEAFAPWVERYTFAEDVSVSVLAGQAALLLVGPSSLRLASDVLGEELRDAGETAWTSPGVAVSVRAYGPLPGVVATGAAEDIEDLRAAWVERGAVALDADAHRQLRVEAGVPAAPHELTDRTFPLEAGLAAEVSFTKGCYTGQEVVARQDTYGKVARRLVGMAFATAPPEGTPLAGGHREGRVTTVAPWPTPEVAGRACLGYVRSTHGEPGTALVTEDGAEGQVVALPFPRLA